MPCYVCDPRVIAVWMQTAVGEHTSALLPALPDWWHCSRAAGSPLWLWGSTLTKTNPMLGEGAALLIHPRCHAGIQHNLNNGTGRANSDRGDEQMFQLHSFGHIFPY